MLFKVTNYATLSVNPKIRFFLGYFNKYKSLGRWNSNIKPWVIEIKNRINYVLVVDGTGAIKKQPRPRRAPAGDHMVCSRERPLAQELST
jgi:hypothetical protein